MGPRDTTSDDDDPILDEDALYINDLIEENSEIEEEDDMLNELLGDDE